MFSSVFYLFLALTLLTIMPFDRETASSYPWLRLFLTLLSSSFFPAILLLTLLFFKKKRKKLKPLFYHLFHISLLFSLAASLKEGVTLQLINDIGPSIAGVLLPALFMIWYFAGLFLFHYATYYPRTLYPESLITSALDFAKRQVRILLPFCIPYFLLLLLISAFPDAEGAYFAALLTALLVLIVLFLPLVVVSIWQMEPIDDTGLLQKMEEVCHKASFHYRKLGTWTVMDHTMTAAILGVIPRFRYILFTRRLLNELEPQEVLAVLAHEIGHARRGHLYKIPFVMIGMPLGAYLILIKSGSMPEILSIALLFLYFGLYFRYLFGYFIRLFEREADLFSLELISEGPSLIDALDRIASLSGGIHDKPSWHHYSIRERMDFLGKVKDNPALIEKHTQKIRTSLAAYLLLLFIIAACLT